jgi:small subunit ribosomal protein S2
VTLVKVEDLIEAGVHLGHKASRWNPKMRPFIYGKRHHIHIINLKETIRGLFQATHFLRNLAGTGAQILFLGTKRQIRSVVDSEAARCGMPAITERWIGGTLTNFNTVRERLKRLDELEAMEADGSMETYKKKNQATLRREMRKIRRNLEGVRDLHGLPGALIVVDPRREEITVREAARMNVPVVCILDTDCNPDSADIVIPGNDDAMASVQLLMSKLADAIIEGRQGMSDDALARSQRAAADDARTRAVAGRRTQERPRRPRSGPGGRAGRTAGGRFAERHGGHSDSISFGTEAATEAKGAEADTAATTDAAAAKDAPAETKADTPAETKADAPAEAKADAPAKTPADAAPESAPESTEESKD